jgi:hypothetical protein
VELCFPTPFTQKSLKHNGKGGKGKKPFKMGVNPYPQKPHLLRRRSEIFDSTGLPKRTKQLPKRGTTGKEKKAEKEGKERVKGKRGINIFRCLSPFIAYKIKHRSLSLKSVH